MKCELSPDGFSTAELRDLANTWPLYRELDLPDRAVVVIAGAYQGKLMEFMIEAFPWINNVVGFEPTAWAWQLCVARLKELSKTKEWYADVLHSTKCWRFGLLADDTETLVKQSMYNFETDGQSLVPNVDQLDKPQGSGSFLGVSAAFKENVGLAKGIDLFIMNLEGYEFKLLPYMLEHGVTDTIKGLAVQFHPHAMPPPHEEAELENHIANVYGPPKYDHFPQWVWWQR